MSKPDLYEKVERIALLRRQFVRVLDDPGGPSGCQCCRAALHSRARLPPSPVTSADVARLDPNVRERLLATLTAVRRR